MLFPQYIKEEFIFFSSLRPFRVYPNSLHSAYSSALTTLLYSLVSIPISLSVPRLFSLDTLVIVGGARYSARFLHETYCLGTGPSSLA